MNTDPAAETAVVAPLSPHAMLCGGEEVSITYRTGKKESVFVRLMALRELESYLKGIDNVSDLVEFACQRPKGWSDELLPDSVLDLDEVARKLNDPILDRLIERQVKAIQKMKPVMGKLAALASST